MSFLRNQEDTSVSGFAEALAYFNHWGGSLSVEKFGLRFDDNGAVGFFDELVLHSAFQPVLHAGTLRPFAFEALLRAQDGAGAAVSPSDAFRRPTTVDEISYFDRLCRITHVVNFVTQARGDEFLFLNVDGRHLLGAKSGTLGDTFTTLLRHCGGQPSQIVLEILEYRIDDLQKLSEAVAAYQERGYRIALDDFGSRHSNYDRLWQVSPDIVKLDRNLLVQAVVNIRARRVFSKVVETIHELEALVVCEGVETEDQHKLAVDAGVDLLQGYYYARPAAQLFYPPPPSSAFTDFSSVPAR